MSLPKLKSLFISRRLAHLQTASDIDPRWKSSQPQQSSKASLGLRPTHGEMLGRATVIFAGAAIGTGALMCRRGTTSSFSAVAGSSITRGGLMSSLHCCLWNHHSHWRRYEDTSVHSAEVADVGIVGGGIVGLATARELKLRHPGLRIVLFEKVGLLPLTAYEWGHLMFLFTTLVLFSSGWISRNRSLRATKQGTTLV